MHFDKGMLEADIRQRKIPYTPYYKQLLRKIEAEVEVRCEDRTFDEFDNECPSWGEVCGEVEKVMSVFRNSFRPFYDAVIGPIADLLGSQFDELVIVSDGALCFTP